MRQGKIDQFTMKKTCILLFLLLNVEFNEGQEESCNLEAAESCAIDFQRQYDESYMEFENQVNHTQTVGLSNLCRSVLKDNDLTKCYDDNIKLCSEASSMHVKRQWAETVSDTTEFCNNSVCANFQGLSTCASKIYENGIQDGQVERFCRTFNESLLCAYNIINGDCLFTNDFYYQLLANPTKGYYVRACYSGCSNLDETVAAINACWGVTRQRSLSDCERHIQFRSCMHEKAVICPEIGKIVPNLRYYHYEQMCTTTPLPTTTSSTTEATTTVLQTTRTETTTTIPTTEMTRPETTETKTTIKLPFYTVTDVIALTTEPEAAITTVKRSTETEKHSTSKEVTIKPTSSNEVKIPEMIGIENNKTDEVRNITNTCFQKFGQENLTLSFNRSMLDFPNCMIVISIMNCFYASTNSSKDIVTLYNFLPPQTKSLTSSEVFKDCQQIISRHSSYITRLESSCSRHPSVRNPGCTGNGFGILGCGNGSNYATKARQDFIVYILAALGLLLLNENSIL